MGIPKQNIKDINKLYSKCSSLKKRFDNILIKIAKKVNTAKAIIVPLKDKEKVFNKIKLEYKGDCSSVKDILRGSILVDETYYLYLVEKELEKHFKILRKKNRFKKPTEVNYGDIKFDVYFDGVVAEVLVQLEKLYNVKEYIGHMFYEIKRTIDHQHKKEKRRKYSWEKRILSELALIEQFNNEQAWQKQIFFEKCEDPNSIIYYADKKKKYFDYVKKFIPSLKFIKMDMHKVRTYDLKEYVKEKALGVQRHIDGKFIVRSVGLNLKALKGFPGPLLRAFLDKFSLDDIYNILKMKKNFEAESVCIMCFSDENNELHFFEKRIKGKIVKPRGKSNLRTRRIFQPKGYNKTLAEIKNLEDLPINIDRTTAMAVKEYIHKRYGL